VVSHWEVLGIAPTGDEGEIRKAYAQRLRVVRPETHPREFSDLRLAYEAALAWARSEAAAAPAGDEREAGPSTADAQRPANPDGEQAAAPEPERPYAAAEKLIAQLAKDFSEGGEIQGVNTLYRQFEEVSGGTVDARLEWEVVLLQSLLSARLPPPVLLFEGDRLLRWAERLPDVAKMFGDTGAQRLRLLLDMAHECIYARHFSPNRWHARLFGVAAPQWFGAMAMVENANRTAAYWRGLAETAELPDMLQLLSEQCVLRISGLMLLSTDVLFAALMAFFTTLHLDDPLDMPTTATLVGRTVLSFVVALLLPLLGRWLWRTSLAKRFRQWWSSVSSYAALYFGFVALLMLMLVAISFAGTENSMAARVPAITLLALSFGIIAAAAGTFCWVVLRWCERLACWPWLWAQRVWGNLRFQHTYQRLAPPTLAQQLRNLLPAAKRGWSQVRERRRANRQQQAAQAAASAASGGNNWWWIFGAIVLLNALARLVK
jgi:hypothetical protein